MHVVSGRNSVADPAGGFWNEVGGGRKGGAWHLLPFRLVGFFFSASPTPNFL